MNNSKESIFADLRTYLSSEMPFRALAERAEAGGHAALARHLRAAQVSETTRRRLILNGIIHHQDDLLELYICPHCGLLFAPEPPETCPVDETPGASFVRVF